MKIKNKQIKLTYVFMFIFAIAQGQMRMFSFGDKQYAVSPDTSLISDFAARDILRTVKEIYDSGAGSDARCNTVWNDMHKVCRGDVYDEALFTSLRIRLNGYLDALNPPSESSGNNAYYYGQLIKRGGANEDSVRSKTKNDYSGRRVQEIRYYYASVPVWLAGEYRTIKGTEERVMTGSRGGYNSSLGRGAKRDAIQNAHKNFEEQLPTLLGNAIDVFVQRIDDDLEMFVKRTDSSGYVRQEHFENILIQLPRAILSVGSQCGESVAMRIAGKLTTVGFGHTSNEETRSALREYAIEKKLNYEEVQPFQQTPKSNIL